MAVIMQIGPDNILRNVYLLLTHLRRDSRHKIARLVASATENNSALLGCEVFHFFSAGTTNSTYNQGKAFDVTVVVCTMRYSAAAC